MCTVYIHGMDELRRIDLNLLLALPHWSAALEVLAGTDLVLTVGSRAIGDLRRHKTLRRFAPPLELPRFAYQQAWHVRKQGDAMHRWLRNSMAQCCTAQGQTQK